MHTATGWERTMMNWNPKRVIFVPGCMLCPAFQAVLTEKNMSWQQEIINYLISRHIGIVQMPCPEASFQGYQEGTARGAHGISYYENLPGFQEHCAALGKTVAGQITELTQAGYSVMAIIGIEHSPTCAASYMYTNHGTEKRQGIYINIIKNELSLTCLDIPFIGVNRRYPEKFLRNIKQLCEGEEYGTHNSENFKSK